MGGMGVSLFITCLTDTLFPEVGVASLRLLDRLGQEVEFDPEQTCCGQMHGNSGYRDDTLALMKRFLRVFGDQEQIVAPSASCIAMIRHHYPRLAAESGDSGLVREVDSLVGRSYEICEFIVDQLGVVDVGAYYPHRVTYHASCHGLRILRLGERPRRLLSEVEGLELVEMNEPEECCGFGGTFAVKNAPTSAAMLGDKLDSIAGTGAEVCTATDSSCLMHIGGGLRRQGASARAVHIVEILAQTKGATA
jgi:L-lactate dehydrogenase complex protein LldE